MWIPTKIELNNHFLAKSLHQNDVSVLYSLVDYNNSLWLHPQLSGHHMEKIQQSITIQSLLPPGTLAQSFHLWNLLGGLGGLGSLYDIRNDYLAHWHMPWHDSMMMAWQWHNGTDLTRILQSGVWLLNSWTSVALALYTYLCTGPTL